MEAESVFIRPICLRLLLEFVGRVFQRGRNHVLSAGPFSEIDSAATLTAEGEIGAAALDRLFADRALQLEMIGHVVASSTRNDLTIGS